MIRPIKHLGQNFLTSKRIVKEIVDAADLKPDDIVLEAGPGRGILTEAILEKIPKGKLIAVEKDKRLVEFLWTKFSDSIKVSQLKVIYGNILKFNPGGYGLVAGGYKIVANIPYYLTSRFLKNFLSGECQPKLMVLIVQKEVAERIAGAVKKQKNLSSVIIPRYVRDGRGQGFFALKESILSLSVKAYGKPKIIKIVPARYFYPQPKVDSAILLIDKISKVFFKDINEKIFFETVKKGFSSKRKMLKNNLRLSNTRCLTGCGIPEKARPEDLSLDDWKCLAKIL